LVEEALRDLLNKYQAKKGRLPKSKLTQMQKKDIAQRIHQEAAISEEEAATLLNWILELFKSTPQKGEPVVSSNLACLQYGIKLHAEEGIHEQARKS
jgi:Bacterial DNA-binding protein